MTNEVTPERLAAIAAAARVPLAAAAAARVASAVAPVKKRLAEGDMNYPFETEPASFMVAQRRERGHD